VPTSWEIENPALVGELQACVKEFLSEGGTEKLLAKEKSKVEKNPAGLKHFEEMKDLHKGNFEMKDFVTFFHGMSLRTIALIAADHDEFSTAINLPFAHARSALGIQISKIQHYKP
jgi:hypothetical protein